MVELVVPAAAARVPAVPVRGRHVGKPRLLNFLRVGGVLDPVHVVDVPRRVELRHEERVAVPELGLHERPVVFLEAERDELILDVLQKLDVGVRAPGDYPRGGDRDVVAAENALLPLARGKHLGVERADFLARDSRALEGRDDFLEMLRKLVEDRLALDDLERRVGRAALLRERRNDLLFIFAQRGRVELPAFAFRRLFEQFRRYFDSLGLAARKFRLLFRVHLEDAVL